MNLALTYKHLPENLTEEITIKNFFWSELFMMQFALEACTELRELESPLSDKISLSLKTLSCKILL